MRTIAILNQKGGVGKTTTVVNAAAALAAMGSRVLAIDLDPQAHLTIHLGLEPQTIEAGSYKVLTQSAPVGNQIMLTRLNLWILPANIDLVGAETELVSVVGREIILREALDEVADKFDFCLIDCPPSLGLLTLNALAAAQEVLIPLQPHFLALQGFGKLLQTIELVNRRINPRLKVDGILLCMFDTRASLPSEVRADIERFLTNARGTNCAWANARILPTFIRRNIKLAEAPSYGKTIFEYEPDCHGAEDYRKVAEFIGARFQPQPQPPGVHRGPEAPSPPGPQPLTDTESAAPNTMQASAPLNSQPVNSDDAPRNVPIEIRQIGRSSPQAPPQPRPNPPDHRDTQSRITQIEPPNPPKPNQEPAPATPAEPPQD